LHHLGDHRHLPECSVFAAKRAAEYVSLPSLGVSLNAITTGASGKALVIPAEGAGLVTLHQGLGVALR